MGGTAQEWSKAEQSRTRVNLRVGGARTDETVLVKEVSRAESELIPKEDKKAARVHK
jgi:hypothetical protein